MHIAIIGATGSIGSVTRQYFLDHGDDFLTLMARHTASLGPANPNRERIVSANVTDPAELRTVLQGQDAVFAALSGDLPAMAQALVTGMDETGVKRLIFISSMGIYNEIPASVGAEGNLAHNPMLRPYREAADVVETSDLDYTVIRPGWFDNGDDADYQVTRKGEPFGGHDVARRSIADLVFRLAHDPKLGSRESLGINRR